MTLLGLSFAVLVAPLTASVMSSVDQTDEGLASGVNNAASWIAQLAGVALAAGVASFESRRSHRNLDRRRVYCCDNSLAGTGETRGLVRLSSFCSISGSHKPRPARRRRAINRTKRR